MKSYLGVKVVEAESMSRSSAGRLGLVRNWDSSDEDEPGYRVVYEDGYVSWSPSSAFEKAYLPLSGLSFSDALIALKAGLRVSRSGWNGKGMFLWLKQETVIKSDWCKDLFLRELVDAEGGEILGLGTVCMYTHDSTGRKAILTGWLASQSDMLSEDWIILD
jgi:hypothetical protein